MTRIGKIARLPHKIREELNRRLQDGEPGGALVDWLNSRPRVRAVLGREFGGRAISEQNLSEWRQGGYADWLRQEESTERIRRMAEHSDKLEAAAEGKELSDRLARVLAAELAGLAEKLLAETEDPRERWKRLQEVLRELAQLRKEDHRAARLAIESGRWDMEFEAAEKEKMKRQKQEQKDEFSAPFRAYLRQDGLAQLYGGGKNGMGIATMLLENEFELPFGTLRPRSKATPGESNRVKPGQTESNQIKADQMDDPPATPCSQ